MSRWRAFFIHLGISLGVIGVIAFGLFYLWYPPHLLGFAKAGTLFGLIAGIDIVVGPLLTLIVYKAGKKTLKFDLSVIAVLQLACLAYGLWTAWISRPVFIVASVDRLQVVFANEIDPASLGLAREERFSRLPWFGPRLVGAQLPDDPAERSALLNSALAGQDVDKFPRYYVDYAVTAPGLLARSTSPAVAAADWPQFESELREAQHQQGLRVVPIQSSRGQSLALIAPDSALPLRSL